MGTGLQRYHLLWAWAWFKLNVDVYQLYKCVQQVVVCLIIDNEGAQALCNAVVQLCACGQGVSLLSGGMQAR